jgi:hypothetical protein
MYCFVCTAFQVCTARGTCCAPALCASLGVCVGALVLPLFAAVRHEICVSAFVCVLIGSVGAGPSVWVCVFVCVASAMGVCGMGCWYPAWSRHMP